MKNKVWLEKIDQLLKRQIGLGKILFYFVVVTIAVIAGVIGARMIFVPSFTAANDDYRFQWHRTANQQEWKSFKVKYHGSSYCKDCHQDQYEKTAASVHARIECENCHGPAGDHPDNPQKLSLNKTRDLCLRCHSDLPYRTSKYAEMPKGAIQLKMVAPDDHNPGMDCVDCHDAHKADFK